MKTALITGVTGQDGSYLAELLLKKGYVVHGLMRRSSSISTSRVNHLFQETQASDRTFFLHYADLTDSSRLTTLVQAIQPDEIYNLGAQSHVRVSFDEPTYTGDVTGIASARLLEAVRVASPESKIYQASSSEMFGASPPPQSEETAFYPRSPYGVAKVYSYWMTKNYREAYGLYAVNGILFNHESPRRGQTFVTKKIAAAAAAIKLRRASTLYLGNLDATRDWGYAPEYVEAMWMMLQQDVNPGDFVIATGREASVKDFVELCFEEVGLKWEKFVDIDDRYFRPTEVDALRGDASRAKHSLGWEPSVDVAELASLMVRYELDQLKRGFEIDQPKWRL